MNAGDVTFRPLLSNSATDTFTLSGVSTIDGATLTLTGNGSRDFHLNARSIRVGDLGDASVTVNNGASVSVVNSSVQLGSDPGSTGEVTVDGPEANWMTTFFIFVGDDGDGSLRIQNGGTMSNQNAVIATGQGTTGLATVQGPGSTWATANSLKVGDRGNGKLLIQDGGIVSSGIAIVGEDPSSMGTVTVSGAGSTWTNATNLFVGGDTSSNGGTGTVNIGPEGTVSVGGFT